MGVIAATGAAKPTRRTLVVMGVSGCGKTTVATAMAAQLSWPLVEGDALHPAANIAKMRAGKPLDDLDRAPWLAALAKIIAGWRRDGVSGVITCSALRRRYRDTLRGAGCGGDVCFIHLRAGRQLLAARLRHRNAHFMPASLLTSQLAALEPPGLDERAVTLDVAAPLPVVVKLALAGAGLHGAVPAGMKGA